MIPIAASLVITALWLILSPYSLITTLLLMALMAIPLGLIMLYCLIRGRYYEAITALFCGTGMILSLGLYLPALTAYQEISLTIPQTFSAIFQIERQQYATSATIKLLKATPVADNLPLPASFYNALQHCTLRIYNIDPAITSQLREGEVYQGVLSLRPRFSKNIPGDSQRILQRLARKEIGYGKFETTPQKLSQKSNVEQLRQQTARYFRAQFQYGHYLSALSVGVTRYLSLEDWAILRKTGTIHLVSISGLHLSLTAFYAFVIFRVLMGLWAIKKIAPYKIAAVVAFIIAWCYALIAGLSLPTIRAAIMFSLAMGALLLNRPIFSLQIVSIALLIILAHDPLAILLPGFWLSFMAVISLILTAQIFSTPLKTLLFTQIIISLLLLPLTASFFGEISLISPLINLFAIPWTSLMIMPPLLLGTLLLFLKLPIVAHFWLQIADQSVYVLTKSIEWSASIPYASLNTSRLPLPLAIALTVIPLLILYFIPRVPFFQRKHGRSLLQLLRYSHLTPSIWALRHFKRMPLCQFLFSGSGLLFSSLFGLSILLISSSSQNDHQPTPQKQPSTINLYLLPVGEGLSLLFHTEELTFFFDTGSRFLRFDAGKEILLPTLKHLNIDHLDQLFLSLQNQQHIGGTRSLRTKFQNTPVIAAPKLLSLIDGAQNCHHYHYVSETITIRPIMAIKSSCAFHITLFKTVALYLFSDITLPEWQHFLKQKMRQEKMSHATAAENSRITHNILLLPHQGRRYFPLENFSLQEDIPTTLLFSTKTPSNELLQSLQKNDNSRYYNAYYGTIHLQLNKKNAKSTAKLRIHHNADSARYWWLQP